MCGGAKEPGCLLHVHEAAAAFSSRAVAVIDGDIDLCTLADKAVVVVVSAITWDNLPTGLPWVYHRLAVLVPLDDDIGPQFYADFAEEWHCVVEELLTIYQQDEVQITKRWYWWTLLAVETVPVAAFRVTAGVTDSISVLRLAEVVVDRVTLL